MTAEPHKALTDDGKAFCQCPSGGIDYGVLAKEHTESFGLPNGPIRLQVGYPGEKGFGHLHIQGYADRVKQIQGLGYKSVYEFCFAVAANYTVVGRAKDGRVVLVWKTSTYDLQLIVQWNEDHWTIVTGIPTRVARKFEKLCEVERTGGSEPTPDVAKRPRFATLSLPKKAIAGGNGP
jgi:hypothetical protein